MRAKPAFEKLTRDYSFQTVLDYGCGINTPHREPFEKAGKDWIGHDIATGWLGIEEGLDLPVDCLWASHVLEHMRDPVKQMMAWRKNYLKPGGILCVTVPPRKDEIVGGHINLYNAGLLLYQMVLAGYDCSGAAVKTQGYDISVIVEAPPGEIRLPKLNHDTGDIEKLAEYLPEGCRKQSFNGAIKELNW